MKVLQYIGQLEMGGMERAMQEFAIALKAQGISVIVAAPDIDGPRCAILKSAGIGVHKVSYAQINEFIANEKVTVVHSHGVELHLDVQNKKKGVILCKEVVFVGDYQKDANLNIVISNSLLYKVQIVHGKPALETCVVLAYPQNTQRWLLLKQLVEKKHLASREACGFRQSDVVLGRIGRPQINKYDPLYLLLVPRVCKSRSNARWLFVGMPRLYEWLLRIHPFCWGKLHFVAASANDKKLATYYELMDIFVHAASWGETFGNVNTEAMMFSKPVITLALYDIETSWYRDNAQIDVVDHGKTGFVITDHISALRACEKLIDSSSLRLNMGKCGKAKVISQYDSNIVAKLFVSLVDKVSSSKLSGNNSRKIIKHYSSAEVIATYRNRFSQKYESRKSYNHYARVKKFVSGVEYIYLVARRLCSYVGINLERK